MSISALARSALFALSLTALVASAGDDDDRPCTVAVGAACGGDACCAVGVCDAASHRCPAPPASNCCVGHQAPSCDDAACETSVCTALSICCVGGWTTPCVTKARELCPDLCPSATTEAP